MDHFFSEVSYQIHHPKAKNNNLNKKAISQIENSGVKVNFYLMKNTNIGACRENPIVRLYEKKKLTRQEAVAALRYQQKYQFANVSHHARPSYDGTPISAVSTKKSEPTPSQKQIDADGYVTSIKSLLATRSGARQIKGFKKNGSKAIFTRDLKLPEILTCVFEREIAIRNVEHILGINHNLIEDRIAEICQILLESANRNS